MNNLSPSEKYVYAIENLYFKAADTIDEFEKVKPLFIAGIDAKGDPYLLSEYNYDQFAVTVFSRMDAKLQSAVLEVGPGQYIQYFSDEQEGYPENVYSAADYLKRVDNLQITVGPTSEAMFAHSCVMVAYGVHDYLRGIDSYFLAYTPEELQNLAYFLEHNVKPDQDAFIFDKSIMINQDVEEYLSQYPPLELSDILESKHVEPKTTSDTENKQPPNRKETMYSQNEIEELLTDILSPCKVIALEKLEGLNIRKPAVIAVITKDKLVELASVKNFGYQTDHRGIWVNPAVKDFNPFAHEILTRVLTTFDQLSVDPELKDTIEGIVICHNEFKIMGEFALNLDATDIIDPEFLETVTEPNKYELDNIKFNIYTNIPIGGSYIAAVTGLQSAFFSQLMIHCANSTDAVMIAHLFDYEKLRDLNLGDALVIYNWPDMSCAPNEYFDAMSDGIFLSDVDGENPLFRPYQEGMVNEIFFNEVFDYNALSLYLGMQDQAILFLVDKRKVKSYVIIRNDEMFSMLSIFDYIKTDLLIDYLRTSGKTREDISSIPTENEMDLQGDGFNFVSPSNPLSTGAVERGYLVDGASASIVLTGEKGRISLLQLKRIVRFLEGQ